MTLKFAAKLLSSATENSECLIAFAKGKKLAGNAAKTIDKAIGGKLTELLKAGCLGEKAGDHITSYQISGKSAKRILLVQLGKESFTDRSFLTFVDGVAQLGLKENINQLGLLLDKIKVEERDTQWQVRKLTEALITHSYRYDDYKSDKPAAPALSTVNFWAENKTLLAQFKKGAAIGGAIGIGTSMARDLGNCPPNICNPVYLSKQAKTLARGNKKVKVKVLGEKEMESLGMGSFLSVGRGSKQPSQLITLEYTGGKKGAAPFALVGKAITFDSGGISLKPGAAMDEMKFDMCGAASVFGCLKAVVEMDLPINLVCVIAAAENMPSGDASRPGDIVTSMSGKTIEILNTDAEGRLVLCDALTYVQKYKPRTIIDLATLTGAVIGALGKEASGLLSNDDDFAKTLINAGLMSGDRVWQLPLWDDYAKQLKSPFADIANIGGPGAGTITAACFLAEFTKEATWAHIDICGTAWLKGEHKGATGRPVGLLTEYLMNVHGAIN